MNEVKKQTAIFDTVIKRITEMQQSHEIVLPRDYSPENAIKSAYLILQDLKDKNQRPVLEVCTPTSVANALFKMVLQGLNPARNQCYFVAFGNQLQLIRSYAGSLALAKRCGLIDIRAHVIYEGDIFEYIINKNGNIELVKHEQKLENIKNDKIRGAYAVYDVKLNDGTIKTDMAIMTYEQIVQAWLQGSLYSQDRITVHNKFADEMSKKVVINRVCKTIINSADDKYLNIIDETDEFDIPTEEVDNFEELQIIDAVEEEKKEETKEEKKEEVKEEKKEEEKEKKEEEKNEKNKVKESKKAETSKQNYVLEIITPATEEKNDLPF